ncbi:salivary peroxidase/catechol oxidase-like [Anticarsia gemmatalis]|uniref:salivary peroxidase/catechol oxidase-like n=1 Tax=Anticarsia gemmatalis TaxID=129554 RepID=UPI003F75AFD6
MQHCPLRGAPKCPPASKRYRTHDGTCNNINRPRWGSTMTPVQRFLPPSYSDGLQAPRRSIFGSKLPSAREISSSIHEDKDAEAAGVTHLLMQWGQFVDHDVTSSSQSRGFNGSVPRCCKDGGRDFVPAEFLHPECFPIPVPSNDPFYGPKGVRCLDFVRSSPAPRDDCALGWREQLNQVSAYLDGSPLYGSSAVKSDKLRLFRNGMLQYGRVQQRRPVLPPERRDELCRGGAVSTDCFKSGDARVNEHPGLVAAHIVWMRQHNRMAQELAHLNPHWSDEKIYQETRKIVGAMIQHITYREFLPIVLGNEVIHRFELELQKKGYYKGYNPKINPSPASSFGSAAFRFGHSLVQSSMVRFDRFHRPMSNNVSLHNELTNPTNIWSIGAVDRLLLGMLNQPIQKRDEFITEELTNHLFQTPQFDFGMDLAAINIQRGRDHGVPPYTAWREPCGLSAIEEFEDLFRVMPSRAARKMMSLYRHVDDIDLFTAGMAERPVMGGLVGPTFACIIAQQFSSLRKGDRFWYENGGQDSALTPAQLQQIRRISFAQVLCRTLDSIETVQPFVFLSPDNPDNDRISCQNGLLNNFDLSPWIEIDSDSDNDIRKSDDRPTTQKPKKKSTTHRPTTTKRTVPKGAVKLTQNKLILNTTVTKDTTAKENITDKLNTTKLSKDDDNDELNLNIDDVTTLTPDNVTKTDSTTKLSVTRRNVQIDDKLDFKNKSRRVDDIQMDSRQRPAKYDEYDYDDEDTQQVQSVVINNVAHKRPYNQRPVITVTENVNKYTYLINYVPRPTESWRQTTRRATPSPIRDRDVVKVTYQTYDDTYRRPNRPYYYDNRHENQNYRYNRPTYTTRYNYHSSARSNDDNVTNKATDKPDIKSTTDLYKLVTFGYVGTYKGSSPTTEKPNDITDRPIDRYKAEPVKDFSTFDVTDKNMKLSTFYLYDTATKPYLQRPTRRNDEVPVQTNKYYYIRNVLHKYSNGEKKPVTKEDGKEILKENYNNPGSPDGSIEERSSMDKMASLEDVEAKPKSQERQKNRVKVKPTNAPAGPSVAFDVIPSEISPSQWAVYEENKDLPEQHRMPTMKSDPYALKEIPRPIIFSSFRRRRPGHDRH